MLKFALEFLAWWRAPMLEAERIVYEGDRAALFRAAALAADPNQPYDFRRRNSRILRVAIERHELARGVDTATRYGVREAWRNRYGSLIGR